MLTVLGIAAVVLLILANGYFVAAEFSFVAARRGRLESGGDRRAARAVQVHRRLSFMLSGAQLGITVTSLVVGFVAEPALARALEPVLGVAGIPEGARFGLALSVAFVLATVGQMVFGELAPKNLAIARPEPIARALGPSTWLFMRLASPLIRVFDGSANWLLRRVGIEPVDELHGGISPEELDLIVEESAEQGKLDHRQAALLARVLDFGDLRAAGAMVPWNRVVTVPDTATGADLREVMIATGHSRFPVVTSDDTVAAVVHAKDLLGVPAGELGRVGVDELARPVLVVPETAGLRAVLAQLRVESTELAVVADEYGAPAGSITLEDLVEELVGDIEDEYDQPGPDRSGAEREPGGAWVVPADWRPDQVERATGMQLPPDEYDTVAGYVLDRLQRLAQVGDRVEVAGVGVEVVAVDGWAVTRVRLRPAGGASGDAAGGLAGEAVGEAVGDAGEVPG